VCPFPLPLPQVASSLNNLGVVLEAMGRYDEALDALNQCHTLQLQLLAADHPDVAATLNNLGKVLHRAAQHDEALAMLRQALRIRERSFGPSHPKVRERPGRDGKERLCRGRGLGWMETHRERVKLPCGSW